MKALRGLPGQFLLCSMLMGTNGMVLLELHWRILGHIWVSLAIGVFIAAAVSEVAMTLLGRRLRARRAKATPPILGAGEPGR